MEPIRVLITGAAGQIGYSLIYQIAKGNVFGEKQPLDLVLLDIQPMLPCLEGVVMEIQDCAFPLLHEVIATANEEQAFTCIDVAILVGAMPRREGMERKDLLAANVKIFKSQGQALDKFSKKTVKVVVVGNPANTNAFIASKYAPSLPKTSFSALTRLDQNRAQFQVAHKCQVPVADVKNVLIWGNHSSTQFPDVGHATVTKNGAAKNATCVIGDDNWIKNEFVPVVQKRGAAVIAARKLSSAMSAGKAIGDHMRDWWSGIPDGEFVSMGVYSDGSYEIPKDIIFSFPVHTKPDHSYTIVQGLKINDHAREMLEKTAKELIEERDMALQACSD